MLETSMSLRRRNKQSKKSSRSPSLTSTGAKDTPSSLHSLVQTDDTPPSLHSLVQTDDTPPSLHSLVRTGDTVKLKELLTTDLASVK